LMSCGRFLVEERNWLVPMGSDLRGAGLLFVIVDRM
jgi:hypothetical protein